MSSPAVSSTARPVAVRFAAQRVVAIRLAYALLSLWALTMAFVGVFLLTSGQLPSAEWRFAATSVAAWKLLSLGPAIAILWTGGRSVLAVRALAVGQLSWFAADLLSPQSQASTAVLAVQAVVSMMIWVGPWLLLAPNRSRLWRQPLDVNWRLVVIAGVAAGPLLVWALLQTRLDVTGGTATLPLRELRFDMTGLPLMLAISAVLAALHRRRWAVRVVAVAWVYVGTLAVTFGNDWGSPGPAAGIALAVAGITYGAVARRRTQG